ncbi:HEPN domain-containing protein [Achromobacter xylosoxidans]|uniref:HEPN domain-containing protein n=1 Tax=Alcaligenes xylosoxydans xylosoxydans TaxID=85698 RepID=UPI001EEDCC2F|nr:HEPN domain-containing protein [Achromobacter xylosoxidans]
MYDFTNGEFAENMSRVSNLIAASKDLVSQKASDIEPANDVLRAAVVFLHSSLEEIIRNLYLHRLPSAGTESLNRVPFAAHEPSHRPKSIQLGDLLEYQGQFIDNVIRKSINQYVNTLNINNASQLVDCLKLAKVPHEDLRRFFEPLDSLMKRRHQIVHQMDRTNELDPLASPVASIDANIVDSWRAALNGFATALFDVVPAPHEGI